MPNDDHYNKLYFLVFAYFINTYEISYVKYCLVAKFQTVKSSLMKETLVKSDLLMAHFISINKLN